MKNHYIIRLLHWYETLKQKRMWEVYGALVLACEKSGVIAPSYKAFTKEIKHRTGYEQTKKRQDRRAAYQHESFYWELTQTTPRHGDRLALRTNLAHIVETFPNADDYAGEKL